MRRLQQSLRYLYEAYLPDDTENCTAGNIKISEISRPTKNVRLYEPAATEFLTLNSLSQ
jgi:hypothetical protein